MKKIGILAVIMMLMAVVTAAQADVRPGGLPELNVDNRIKNCNCVLFPECCAKQAPASMKEKVTIDLNVEFDTAKAVIKEKYYNKIKKVADFMKKFTDTNATIEGHTDNVGKAEYNQKLSEARANSVRQYLIDKFGIDGSRLTAVGYGETRPIASNDTEQGRQKNRRVQAVIKTVTTK